jgi:hypothetical protein
MNGSLFIERGTSHPPNPEPISKLFVAGMPSIACAKSDSIDHSNIFDYADDEAHNVLPLLDSAMYSVIIADAAVSGPQTGTNSSTFVLVIESTRDRKAGSWKEEWGALLMEETCVCYQQNIQLATISMPFASLRYFSAIAPAYYSFHHHCLPSLRTSPSMFSFARRGRG